MAMFNEWLSLHSQSRENLAKIEYITQDVWWTTHVEKFYTVYDLTVGATVVQVYINLILINCTN